MSRADEEIVDFLARGTTPQSIATFKASPAAKRRVADLIAREKSDGLSADEKAELDHCIEIERLMRLLKARVRPSP